MEKTRSMLLLGTVAISVVVSVVLLTSSSVFAGGSRGGERHEGGAMMGSGRQISDFGSGSFQKHQMPCMGTGTTQSGTLCGRRGGEFGTGARISLFMSGGLHKPLRDCSESGCFLNKFGSGAFHGTGSMMKPLKDCDHKFGSGSTASGSLCFPPIHGSGSSVGFGKKLQVHASGALNHSGKNFQKSKMEKRPKAGSGSLKGSKR